MSKIIWRFNAGSHMPLSRFILVSLQIERLCQETHESGVRQAMRQLSAETLDDLYSEHYEKIKSAGITARTIAINAFALLLCLREPLTPSAFLTAVTSAEVKQRQELRVPDLLRICLNLVMVDSQTNTLRFIHASVCDFLGKQSELTSGQANEVIALSCVNVCLFGTPTGLENGLYLREHFYHYGIICWAEHCQMAAVSDSTSNVAHTAADFVFDHAEISLPFISWLEDIGGYSTALPRHHPLRKSSHGRNKLRTYRAVYCLCIRAYSPSEHCQPS